MTALPSPISLSAEAITTPEESPPQIILRRFRRHRLAMISIFIMLGFLLTSVFAKQIAPFTPNQITVGNYFLSLGATDNNSGATHWLGTDNIGRDYFSRLLYAGRISLTVALFSVFTSTTFGVAVGAYAGFYGGWLDSVIMRFVEFLLTIPILPILLIVSSILLRNENALPIPPIVLSVAGKILLLSPADARQAVLIIIVLAGLGWLNTAQLMRGMALALRDQTFVEASRSLGMSNPQIILRHLIPNAMAPIIGDVSATTSMESEIARPHHKSPKPCSFPTMCCW